MTRAKGETCAVWVSLINAFFSVSLKLGWHFNTVNSSQIANVLS